ncbi:3',5'-bisphosphate nucleotidase [Phlyctema vagabunda]|uniref:3',5'-bisphosphate nucleotidase n=1 Tax=Phlyctema vagabunda TaxID=108571 RepID=A0ABR4PMA1_9HELO
MSSTLLSHERRIAELAVQRASVLTKKVLRGVNQGALSKSDSSPVTIADFAAQALLISALHAAFPSDTFVGEEDADVIRQDEQLRSRIWELVSTTHLDDVESEALLWSPASVDEMLAVIDLGGRGTGGREGRVWMLDPVDGTATFLKGHQYAVSLALVEDGQELIGVLGCPNLTLSAGRIKEEVVDDEGYGIMLSAVKGHGAVQRPMGTGSLQPSQPIPASSTGPAETKELHLVDYSLSDRWRRDLVRELSAQLGAAYPASDLWSSHMRYAALILNAADVQVRIPPSRAKNSCVWDHAGAQLIYREVGGRITDLDGGDMDFGAGRKLDNWGVVAAKEDVHAGVLEAVKDVLRRDVEREERQ